MGPGESNRSGSASSFAGQNNSKQIDDKAAPSTSPLTSELRKSGACTLHESRDPFDTSKSFIITLENDALLARADLHGGTFFSDFAVFANAGISNKSGKLLSVRYNVAFFDDKDELIASTSHDCNLEPNDKDVQLASCLSRLPRTAFGRIASYKVVIYTEPGRPRG